MVSKSSVKVFVVITVIISVVVGMAAYWFQTQQSQQAQTPYPSQDQELPQRGRQRMPQDREGANSTIIETTKFSLF